MAVNNAGNIGPLMPQNNPAGINDITNVKKTAPAADENQGQSGVIRDKVEISRQAKTISKALYTIANLPETRADEVAKAVQERITENTRVPAATLAAKLLLED